MLRQTSALPNALQLASNFSQPPLVTVSLCEDVEEPPKVDKYRRRVLYRAGEAAPVRALAPRGSRELPASALQKPIGGSDAARPCGLRRLRGVWGAALRLFRDAYENCGGLQNQKRPPTPFNASGL